MTVKGGTVPACAACKFQRRRCSPECPLAPYFPANQSQMFLNVHRLFGVSHVTKTLESVSPELKEDAMRSIIFEAEMRERFPVDGCCAVIAHLRYQTYLAYQELSLVLAKIEACRNQIIDNHKPTHQNQMIDNFASSSFFNEHDNVYGDPYSHMMIMMNNLATMEQGNDMNQFNYDERQSYIESKFEARVASSSSPESSLEDPTQAAEHGGWREAENGELRTAGAGLRLIPVNPTEPFDFMKSS